MVGWIVALISGVLMSIQGVLNTEVTKQTSLWVRSTFGNMTLRTGNAGGMQCGDAESFAGGEP